VLDNAIERALILSGGGVLDVGHFNLDARPIEETLSRADGNKIRAAALLDISERTRWYKLKKGRTGA
jgi:two-component system response regulator AtoC